MNLAVENVAASGSSIRWAAAIDLKHEDRKAHEAHRILELALPASRLRITRIRVRTAAARVSERDASAHHSGSSRD